MRELNKLFAYAVISSLAGVALAAAVVYGSDWLLTPWPVTMPLSR